MDKKFNPQDIEQKWYDFWERKGLFSPTDKGEAYCIAIPPPNVTGTLHMGHAFQSTLIDTLIRYHRMKGRKVLWQMGTDHAGIATQMLVERQCAAAGTNKHKLGREKFIAKIWEWKEQSGNIINNQLKRLGASVDWKTARFTMDEGFCHSVIEAFVRLHEQGFIYRSKKLVNWDPVLQTALSDLEVTAKEEGGTLYYVRYPFVNEKGFMTIATTRPETILADGAIAVHPDSEKYRRHLGKMVHVPRTDRIIPVLADEYVKSEFGTGCVKITPAHDFNDYEVGQRHAMEVINLFTPAAKMNENAPKDYRGMDRYEARIAIIKDLEKEGLLVKAEKHLHSPPRGDRSGVILEPYLTNQWFVKTQELARRAIEVVEQEKIKFSPKRWENTYFAWMHNIQDWCISRQLWWGHRIPAWLDEEGNIFIGRNEEEVRRKYGISAPLKQEEDVLDTWFSSALWTFAPLGWPSSTPRQKMFHPTNLLVTGFDIIFFWVARMIMMTLSMKEEIPFKQVYIHGLVRDAQGQKMSKSKGNILDPLDIIDGIELDKLTEKRTSNLLQPQQAPAIKRATKNQFPQGIAAHGTDALRFTFCALASTGHDLNFDIGRCMGYRNFCNKLWNAARFVSLWDQEEDAPVNLSPIDEWIQDAFARTAQEIEKALAGYRFDLASQNLYEFVWNEYCDWYIEFSKPLMDDPLAGPATRWSLRNVLEKILRLAHPFIPFITEEIWQECGFNSERAISIMSADYPSTVPRAKEYPEIEWLKKFISAARTMRSELLLPPKQRMDFLLISNNKKEHKWLKSHDVLLSNILNSSQQLLTKKEIKPAGKSLVVGTGEILLPINSKEEKEQERSRLNNRLKQLSTEQEKLKAKLTNQNFISKAPVEVVEKNRRRLENNGQESSIVEEQLRLLH